MYKKYKNIGAVLIMLLGVFGFVACNTDDLATFKVTKASEIQEYGDTKGEENYTSENWLILQQAVTDGKFAIKNATTRTEVQKEFNEAKVLIDSVYKKEEGMQNFELIIATDKISYGKDENINIDIFLKNHSGEDIEIAFYFLISPYIPTATNYPATTEMPSEPYIKFFKNEEIIRYTEDLGGFFNPGQHDIKYISTFYCRLGEEDESMIEIWSNTIKITINND